MTKVKEIMALANFHGFDIETYYSDGEKNIERAICLEELDKILQEVLGEWDYEKKN
jgi:hypothetical protein